MSVTGVYHDSSYFCLLKIVLNHYFLDTKDTVEIQSVRCDAALYTSANLKHESNFQNSLFV